MFTLTIKSRNSLWTKVALAVMFVVMLCTTLPPRVKASTEVGGPIISDTTWTVANSPYILIASVNVSEGVTLTIEPGVVVKFTNGTKIEVSGALVARGTASEPIFFTSDQDSPAPGDWENIEFTTLAVPTTFDTEGYYLSGSILEYCVVEYAGQEVDSAIQVRSQLVDHCIVRNNSSRGIYAFSSNLRGNTVSSNVATRGGGIYAINSVLSNNTVTNNEAVIGGGIFADNSIIINNTVVNNSVVYGYILDFGGGGIYGDGSTIDYNIVVSNTSDDLGGGIYADAYSTLSGNVVLKNVTRDAGGGIYAEYNNTLWNNFVSRNSARRGAGIYARSYVDMFQNTVVANTIPETYGWSIAGSGIYNSALFGGGDILSNTIVANRAPADSTIGGLQTADSANALNYNTFYGNIPYDVSVSTPNDVDGTNNYWGSVISVDILAQVYDWYDDSSRGKLLYVPYLQEPSTDAPMVPPTGLTFFLSGDTATLSWDSHPSFTTGYGYKIYYDTHSSLPPYTGVGLNEGDSPIDVGDSTTYTLTGLDHNLTYYFAVTIYDNEGRESWYSDVARHWVYLPLALR